jgi:hypothetical protein
MLEREVVTVRGAPVGARHAVERPRDHATDRVRPCQLAPGDPARLVQLLQRHGLLVRRDLEDRVGRRVDDPVAGPLVLLAEALDDLGARGRDVADHSPSGRLRERADHVVREAVRIGRHRRLGDDGHQLPVARRRVLARRVLAQPAGDRGRVLARRAAAQRQHVAEPERLQVWQVETPDGVGDVLQRARPGVAVGRGVGQLTRADGIEHDHADAAGHGATLPAAMGRPGRPTGPPLASTRV